MAPLSRQPVLALLLASLAAGGCTCDGPSPGPKAQPSASVPAVASSAPVVPVRVPRSTQPSPAPEAFEVKTSDGVVLHGSFWKGGEPNAPAVILAHRLGGDRTEWTPLIERLFPAKKPLNVVAFDLRGHGASTKRKAKPAKMAWQSFKSDDFAQMNKDVESVADWLAKREGGPPAQLILVGSDIGATAVTLAAKASAVPIAAVALVSPGASLRGVDLYEPFGALLALPNLIITAEADNVSTEPARALGAMSKSSTVLRFDGNAHGAEALGSQHWEVWDSLADWVEARVGTGEMIAPSSSASGAPPVTPAASGLVK